MDHERFVELMSDSRDGLLSDAERIELDAHLEGCGDCRATRERWEDYSKTILRPSAKRSSADRDRFVRLVMARIRQEDAAAPSWWKAWSFDAWLVPALSVGVAAAALFIALAPARIEGPAPDEAFLLSQCESLAKWCVRPGRASVGEFLRSLEDR